MLKGVDRSGFPQPRAPAGIELGALARQDIDDVLPDRHMVRISRSAA
jgi:hypothetical protein